MALPYSEPNAAKLLCYGFECKNRWQFAEIKCSSVRVVVLKDQQKLG